MAFPLFPINVFVLCGFRDTETKVKTSFFDDFYRLQTKSREGNVLHLPVMLVSHSVPGGGCVYASMHLGREGCVSQHGPGQRWYVDRGVLLSLNFY